MTAANYQLKQRIITCLATKKSRHVAILKQQFSRYAESSRAHPLKSSWILQDSYVPTLCENDIWSIENTAIRLPY
jgi:hypothetical protein